MSKRHPESPRSSLLRDLGLRYTKIERILEKEEKGIATPEEMKEARILETELRAEWAPNSRGESPLQLKRVKLSPKARMLRIRNLPLL